MPERCVVFGCSNVCNKEKGILLHPIPFYGKADSKKQRRRRKWIDFVKSEWAHWEPSKHLAMCSEHFSEEAYTNWFANDLIWRLKRDEIGACVFPTSMLVFQATKLQMNPKANKANERRDIFQYRSVYLSKRAKVFYRWLRLFLSFSFSFTVAQSTVCSSANTNCDLSPLFQRQRCNVLVWC